MDYNKTTITLRSGISVTSLYLVNIWEYNDVIKATGIQYNDPINEIIFYFKNLELLCFSCSFNPEKHNSDIILDNRFAKLQKLASLSFYYKKQFYFMSYLLRKKTLYFFYGSNILIFKNTKNTIVLDKSAIIEDSSQKCLIKCNIIFYKPSAIIINIIDSIELTITIYNIFRLEIPNNVIILNINLFANNPEARSDINLRNIIKQNIKTGYGCIINIY